MATVALLAVATGGASSWLLLVFAYGVVTTVVLAGTIWLCRDETAVRHARASGRPRPEPAAPAPTMHPFFLTGDERTWLLDGVVDDPTHVDGAPVSLALRRPESEWLGIVVEGLLGMWVDDARDIHLDVTKLDREHTIGLSSENTHFWLELASVSPGLPGSAGDVPSG